MKTIFFGSDYQVANIVKNSSKLECVFCERSRITQGLVDFCGVHNIQLHSVINKHGLNLEPNIYNLGISYGFGIIFNREHIDTFTNGILNIHPGKLPEMRGRHPIQWAFLKNQWNIYLSFHFIDTEIDQGDIVHECMLQRELYDTMASIGDKITNSLSIELPFVLKNLDNREKLRKGTYLPLLPGEYKNIKSNEHSASFIFNLFQTQKTYGSVIVDGEQYTECHFYSPELKNQSGEKIISKDGVTLLIF